MINLKLNGKGPESADAAFDYYRSTVMLISEVSRLMGDDIQKSAEHSIVKQKSGRLLLIELEKKDGRTQLELVNATHMKAPTISVSLQKLESAGLVIRKTDEYDLRATRVYLTQLGREHDKIIKRKIYEEECAALSGFTDSERETILRLLENVRKNILPKNIEEDYI